MPLAEWSKQKTVVATWNNSRLALFQISATLTLCGLRGSDRDHPQQLS
jgi:hypothetical protein